MSIRSYVAYAKSQSHCSRRKVGAAVVFDGRVWSIGFNHIPYSVMQCEDGACPRGQKSYADKPAFADYSDCRATHAEVAACESYRLLYGREVPARAVMYVSCEPCPLCAEYLCQRGITWVVIDV